MIIKTWYYIESHQWRAATTLVVAAGAHAALRQGARPECNIEEKLTSARGKCPCSPQHRQYFL
jgi:hypothetical protein